MARWEVIPFMDISSGGTSLFDMANNFDVYSFETDEIYIVVYFMLRSCELYFFG
jgi:hypothetical protein